MEFVNLKLYDWANISILPGFSLFVAFATLQLLCRP